VPAAGSKDRRGRSRRERLPSTAALSLSTGWHREFLGGAGLLALVVAAYVPAMHGGVLWDDGALIFENRLVRAWDGLAGIWDGTQPWVLTQSMQWLEWRLWGGSTTGYHLLNEMLHGAVAIVTWRVLRRLAVPGAFVVAALFAVHPVAAASVGWVSEQKNTLSLLLFATSTLAWLRFDDGEGRWLYGIALATFLLALLAKTSVVMGPVVLLGLAWYRRGSVTATDVRRTLPFFALSLALGLVTVYVQHATGLLEVHAALAARLAGAAWCVWFYLLKALAPVQLAMIYPRWHISAADPVAWLPFGILLGVLGFAWWRREGWGRAVLAGLGYMLVILLPVLGLIPMTYHQHSLVADHLAYPALVGPLALFVGGVATVVARARRTRDAGVVLAILAVGTLALLTWQRAHVYRDARTLWTDSLAVNPDAWAAHGNLALALSEDGAVGEAKMHYREALRLNPDYPIAHNNLGVLLGREGDDPAAAEHYERAIALNAGYAEAYSNLGNLRHRQGRLDEAEAALRHALVVDPDYAQVYNNLGLVVAARGQHEEAVRHYLAATRLRPDLVEPHHNRGISLFSAGRLSEAADAFRAALDLAPDSAASREGLAVVRGEQRKRGAPAPSL